ncbi:MAG: leucyl/phenylalanyl-tRNA--protein transferase [Pseudomonadota bacterium]
MARDSGSELNVEDLIAAYSIGYFPMARTRDDPSVVWVLPDIRGVLDLKKARAPKKLMRLYRRRPFDISVNQSFLTVMNACAEPGEGREDTWINDAILEAYLELHHRGIAHSVECWDGATLVGGLYGVAIGGVFCGESMFSRATNASKIAMVYLINHLKISGFKLLDTQFYTDHLAQFGVTEMSGVDYHRQLRGLLTDPALFHRSLMPEALDASLPSNATV